MEGADSSALGNYLGIATPESIRTLFSGSRRWLANVASPIVQGGLDSIKFRCIPERSSNIRTACEQFANALCADGEGRRASLSPCWVKASMTSSPTSYRSTLAQGPIAATICLGSAPNRSTSSCSDFPTMSRAMPLHPA